MTGDVITAATPIAIIGMACRYPGADSPEAFWANLAAGVESIVHGPADGDYVRAVGKVDGTENFDAEYFRIPPAEAAAMDPQNRVLLEVAAAALEDSGYLGRNDCVIGVFAGSGENVYLRDHIAPNAAAVENLGELRLSLANEKDFLAPRIAFKLGLRGPSLTVQASCSTGLTAVALACQALAAGDCDIAIAGGVSLLLPDVDGYEYAEGGINSADGHCRTFDKQASGTVPGSGAGVVVLKRDGQARDDRDRRYGVIRGWATNNDGGSRAGFTVPNVEGQETVVRAAMRRAGVHPREISYVEAHGTATPLGDPIEIEALSRVFASDDRGAGAVALGSVKTNIGHTDAAAGVAGLIKATLAVRHGVIPASLHFTEPNPAIEFDGTTLYVNTGATPWPERDTARIAGVSSFGLGGTNAHVIVADAQEAGADPVRRDRQAVVLSARNDADLARVKARLADRLEAADPLSAQEFADTAYTLAVARPPHAARWAGSYAGTEDLVAALRAPHLATGRSTRVSLAVEGGPAELVAMARREAAAEPLAGAALAEYAALLGAEAGEAVFDTLPAPAAGAFAVVVSLRALQLAGVSLARVDAPRFATPAVDWLLAGGPAEELGRALRAGADAPEAPKALLAPDCFVLGPEHRVADAVAHAWARGTAIDWAGYYGSEARRVVSLPTYPFAAQRHWLEKAAPQPRQEDGATAPAGPSSATIAEVVATAWAEVLGLETVGPDADFFELGGDSLSAVEIGARINEELRLSLPLDLPFQTPTIAAMTEFVENHQLTGADA
ncbi:beta-ketoacyl synthase N-terminal-like domain-containing protein [Streptomyces sp. XD-27]|uniref:beta-ketoacyl synthase N-terminal-like domain-containing protein n=1 Tax=Streptomyces sp. XD-27 TaxID=3062779 RepID=UPI0026F41A76|nr:beta-ketoacyl synthase N-terminal-like domain-containing protein [Streptomyces sp. XD-27]WKX73982.1 beta-ketoacyl synthase N-terminal-like domain-containing protein [Streptomyces sp. XD-27]